jgi:hypothetical protein
VRQSTLPAAADGVHALLPLVPNEGEEAMEARRKQGNVSSLQMGHRKGLLEFLRLVPGTGESEVNVPAASTA